MSERGPGTGQATLCPFWEVLVLAARFLCAVSWPSPRPSPQTCLGTVTPAPAQIRLTVDGLEQVGVSCCLLWVSKVVQGDSSLQVL